VVGGFVGATGLVVAYSMFAANGACGPTPCTPDEQGLGDATFLTIRQLSGPPAKPGACAHPRIDVISSGDELQQVYDELGFTPSDADGGAASVDFTRERVIVREGVSGEGISWAVAQGDTGYIGLLACGRADRSACTVNIIAVPALINRAESRTCDRVGCGVPLSPPGRRL
jgi:hypothetical protein